MEDSIVISLPIRPQLKTSLGMTSGLHVGRTIADFLGCQYVLSVNLMNGFAELEKEKECLVSDVAKMGINPDKIWFDNKNIDELVSNIVKMIKKGIVYKKRKTILKCQCGRVCVEKKYADKFGKLFRLENEDVVCNFCNEKCKEIVDDLLVLHVPSNLKTIDVFPSFLSAEVENVVNKYKGKEIVISKPRDTGCIFEFGENRYNLDVEFVWSQIFSCFKEKKLYLLASNHQIYVAAIMGIMAQLTSVQSITFILTPYLNNKSLFDLKDDFYERAWLIRLFVLNSLKWKKKECNWDEGVYRKLEKIEEEKLKELYNDAINNEKVNLSDFLTYSFQTQSLLDRLGRI